MDFYFSSNDPLTVVSSGVVCLLIFILIKESALYLRRIIPSKVFCWFCNAPSLVPYDSVNSWTCGKCEQYNGFSKDGDYNKVLPEQYSAPLNPTGFTSPVVQGGSHGGQTKERGRLCDECNRKQEMKVQQLAAFVPLSERDYDKEVEHFQKQIEKCFGLCPDCESTVSRVLRNLRQELSLPKKLSSAISKINIRGERAIIINLLLSLLLSLTSTDLHLPQIVMPQDLQEKILGSIESPDLHVYLDQVTQHPWTSMLLTYGLHILIGTGILTNAIGYHQTGSPAVFLNILSWILMIFLTLYPSRFDQIKATLMITYSFISAAISVLILVRNHRRRHAKKRSLMEKRNYLKTSIQSTPLQAPRSSQSLRRIERVMTVSSQQPTVECEPTRGPSHSPERHGESPGRERLASSLHNLSLGGGSRGGGTTYEPMNSRYETSLRRNHLIQPAAFNPFDLPSRRPPLSSSRSDFTFRSSASFSKEKSFGKSSIRGDSFKTLYEEPSTLSRPPSSDYGSFDGSDRGSSNSVPTFGGYSSGLPPPPPPASSYCHCLTTSPHPHSLLAPPAPHPTTLCYFATTTAPPESLSKYSPPAPFLPASSTPNTPSSHLSVSSSLSPLWKLVYSLPFIFLVTCNVTLLCTVYSIGTKNDILH